MSCSSGPTSYQLSKFGKEREVLFRTSETEKLRCLISHLHLMGVEAGLLGYGHGFCSVKEKPFCSFQKAMRTPQKRLHEYARDTTVSHRLLIMKAF